MKTTSSLYSLRAAFAVFLAATFALSAQEPPAPPPAPASADRATQPATTTPPPESAPATPPATAAQDATTPAPTETTKTAAPAPAAAAEAEKKTTTAEPPLRDISEPATAPAAAEPQTAPEPQAAPEPRRYGGGDEFPFGNHHVPQGSRMREAVSIFGSTTVEGEVDGDVVSVFGDTTIGPAAKASGAGVAVLGEVKVDGEVGDEAVSVIGGVKINGRVRGDAVSVLGNLELGPKAVVEGDVVVVAGTLKRDPAAIVRGNIVNVPFFGGYVDFEWFLTWLRRCVALGRPLAFGEHLGWAWLVAASFLAFYLLLALLFPKAVVKCATTFETRPGYSILSSILTVFLTPVALVLLAVTIIGVVLVPFVGAGLIGAKLFGKAVMLAWIGRRFTRFFGDGPLGHPAFAVLIGGVLVALLYTVPLFGFLLYKVLSWLGLGVVIYTIALSMKREKPVTATATAGAVAGARPMPSASTSGVSAATGMPTAAAVGAGAGPAVETVPSIASELRGGGVASFGPIGSESFVPPVSGTIPPPVGAAATPVISVATMPRAGFLIRMGALLLDVILVGLLLGLLNGLLPRFLEPEPPAILPLLAIYGAAMWKLRGTTIGGIVCGLKIVRVDDRPVDWATAVVRALSCFLSLFVAGLGFIWIAIDDEKQSWHDKIAGTAVVRVPKGVSLL